MITQPSGCISSWLRRAVHPPTRGGTERGGPADQDQERGVRAAPGGGSDAGAGQIRTPVMPPSTASIVPVVEAVSGLAR